MTTLILSASLIVLVVALKMQRTGRKIDDDCTIIWNDELRKRMGGV